MTASRRQHRAGAPGGGQPTRHTNFRKPKAPFIRHPRISRPSIAPHGSCRCLYLHIRYGGCEYRFAPYPGVASKRDQLVLSDCLLPSPSLPDHDRKRCNGTRGFRKPLPTTLSNPYLPPSIVVHRAFSRSRVVVRNCATHIIRRRIAHSISLPIRSPSSSVPFLEVNKATE